MDKIMEVKQFILKFFAKEAECWTKYRLNDLDSFNKSVRELYSMAIDDLDESLGILVETELEYAEESIVYNPRHLYKLSAYKNKIYGDVWMAYASVKNPDIEPKADVFFQGFIVAYVKGELKIIGTMVTNKNRSTMIIEGWSKSIYNPSDLDIDNLGEFVATERYAEPSNYDGFSLKEYLKDR